MTLTGGHDEPSDTATLPDCYQAMVSDRVEAARLQLRTAPISHVAAAAADALIDAIAALAEVQGRRRMKGAAHDRAAAHLDGLTLQAVAHLALADFAAIRSADAQRAADQITGAFEQERAR